MNSIYIRTDMNTEISTGHVMRCLSIADAAQKRGISSVFILADENAEQLINSRGYETVVLHTPWNQMEREIQTLISFLTKWDARVLIVDSYYVTTGYLSAVSEVVKTVYIDDLNVFNYSVNSIICYANYWRKFDYQKRFSDNSLLLGCDYVPLRQEFSNLNRHIIRGKAENILIMSGGSDRYHILATIMNRLDVQKYKSIDVVCGVFNEDYDMLFDRFLNSSNVKIHKSLSNIVDYYINADIAISAGGTTLYELCACGTPTISYSFADNQLDNVMQFDRDGLIDYAGDVRTEDVVPNIIMLLEKYNNAEYRASKSCCMQKLVDGKGANRIVSFLGNML